MATECIADMRATIADLRATNRSLEATIVDLRSLLKEQTSQLKEQSRTLKEQAAEHKESIASLTWGHKYSMEQLTDEIKHLREENNWQMEALRREHAEQQQQNRRAVESNLLLLYNIYQDSQRPIRRSKRQLVIASSELPPSPPLPEPATTTIHLNAGLEKSIGAAMKKNASKRRLESLRFSYDAQNDKRELLQQAPAKVAAALEQKGLGSKRKRQRSDISDAASSSPRTMKSIRLSSVSSRTPLV